MSVVAVVEIEGAVSVVLIVMSTRVVRARLRFEVFPSKRKRCLLYHANINKPFLIVLRSTLRYSSLVSDIDSSSTPMTI